MDENGVVLKESKEIKILENKFMSLEIEMKSLNQSPEGKEDRVNPMSKSKKCKGCNAVFTRNCDLKKHIEKHKTRI